MTDQRTLVERLREIAASELGVVVGDVRGIGHSELLAAADAIEQSEARLRKAERLAHAVAFHLRVEGPPIDTVVVAALANFNLVAAFRTTEDAK